MYAGGEVGIAWVDGDGWEVMSMEERREGRFVFGDRKGKVRERSTFPRESVS